MQSQFTVLFDSCVLYQAPVRDLLLQLASQGLFRARWSKQIQEEWMKNLLENRPDLDEKRLKHTCDLMNRSILDCIVEDYENLISAISLPDQNDVHVLAAAIKSQSQVIVTFNISDFPEETLKNYDIEIQHPDTFLRYQLDLNMPLFLTCIKTIRQRLKNPPMTAEQYLFSLHKHLPQTVSILKHYHKVV